MSCHEASIIDKAFAEKPEQSRLKNNSLIMEFTLKTAFTNTQLELLYATGTNVIVAKPARGSQPNVAWQVFRPMQANILKWSEEYGVYASTSVVTNGATLSQLSSVPVGAREDMLYTLEPNSIISGPVFGGMPGAFALMNNFGEKPYMTVGLYQNANVNGIDMIGNAISAAPVLLQSTALMTPSNTVYIWLQSQVVSNTVVTMVTSPMTKLTFDDRTTEWSVTYDSASGYFVPAPGKRGTLAEGRIKHIPASL